LQESKDTIQRKTANISRKEHHHLLIIFSEGGGSAFKLASTRLNLKLGKLKGKRGFQFPSRCKLPMQESFPYICHSQGHDQRCTV